MIVSLELEINLKIWDIM